MFESALPARTAIDEMLTGVDGEVMDQVLEQIAAESMMGAMHDQLTGLRLTYTPPVSISTAMLEHYPRLRAELVRVPGAADAIQRLVVSVWQHAFRTQRAFANVAVRDVRWGARALLDEHSRPTGHQAYEIRFSFVSEGEPIAHEVLERGPDPLEFIEKRNAQLAAVFLESPGLPKACAALVDAMVDLATRKSWPLNQIGMRDGKFMPSASGGEQRFIFYRARPR